MAHLLSLKPKTGNTILQITKQLRTETGHRLTNYNGRCAHLHGHSYLWEVTARASKLDAREMVMDFKDLKKAMNTVLDPLDHCMVLSPDDPLLGTAMLAYPNAAGCEYAVQQLLVATNSCSGAETRLVVWHENPTAESFAEWALHKIQCELRRLWCLEKYNAEYTYRQLVENNLEHMPYSIKSVRVWETATSYAEAKSPF